jgi:malate permease and related proteins
MQDILLSFGLIILAGVLFRRFMPAVMDADTLRLAINVSVLNLFLPALCIKILYLSVIDTEIILIPATAIGTTLTTLFLAMGVYYLLGRKLELAQSEKGVLILAAAFGNVTYLGLPVLTGLFGDGSAKYALYYDLLATTPLLWLVGASLASRYGGGKSFSAAEALKTIISLPPVWGIVIGLTLHTGGIALPSYLLIALDMLGSLVVPLMIFSIGLALSIPQVKHAYIVIPAVFIKLFISPAIALIIAKAFGIKGIALASSVIEGGMPTMVLSLLIAARFRLDVQLSAFIILVSTVLSFFTLPLIIYIAGRL